MNASVSLDTFQVLISYIWPISTVLYSTNLELSHHCGFDETSYFSHLRSMTTLGFIYMDLSVKFNLKMIPARKKVKREENNIRTHSWGDACIKE